jgi:hypothetical protein
MFGNIVRFVCLRRVYCVPNVAGVSGLFILDYPFGFLWCLSYIVCKFYSRDNIAEILFTTHIYIVKSRMIPLYTIKQTTQIRRKQLIGIALWTDIKTATEKNKDIHVLDRPMD